jgi:hypothetical protein
VDGETATVQADVETWSRMKVNVAAAPARADGVSPPATQAGTWQTFEPHNLLDVQMTFQRNDKHQWIVQTYTWQFAPGGGP